jgi:uncharacterized protein (TIGR03435 family)
MRALIPVAGFLLSLWPACAQSPGTRPEFEVASIRRNVSAARPYLGPTVGGRFTATNITLKMLISLAWRTQSFAISGAPSWVGTEGYDVVAKEPEPNATDDEFLLMMQNLLKDRFGLRVHTETREMPVYLLLPAKNGLKLPDVKPEACLTFALKAGSKDLHTDPQAGCGGMNVAPGLIENEKVSMAWFAAVLEGVLGRPLIDRTGFTGSFRVRIEFAPIAGSDSESTKPSIFTALQEQLGLRLDSQKGSAEVLVIDHAERPSEN